MSIAKTAFLSLAAVVVFCRAAQVCAADAPAEEYLSDALANRIVAVSQGFGQLGLNTAVKSFAGSAMKLRIKDKHYQHGLGHHATGEIVVDLGGEFKSFLTDVGVQWQARDKTGSVVFQVFVDEKKVFDSGVMRQSHPPRHVSVSVEGADELRLVANDAGDGIGNDLADWADARLIRNPGAVKKALAAAIDIAPFGRVATWDPKVMTGTKANRVEEIPAEDLYRAKELLPSADGTYQVPDWSGTGSIGLRWDENRHLRQLALTFADAASVPPIASVQLQYWSGQSAWQGGWTPATIVPEKADNRLVWSLGYKGFSQGTQKVRWLFTGMKQPIMLKGLSAYSSSSTQIVEVRIQATKPITAQIPIELYNGGILESPLARESGRGAGGDGTLRNLTWSTSSPLTLKLRACITKRYKADRTMLRFCFPDAAFGVAVEDLLANDCVYVPHAGLFVTRVPAPVTLDAYLKRIAAQSTVLDDVRQRADQDFAQAMKVVHNPIQNNGPTMLSLACDNRKFIVHRDGTIVFDEYTGPDDEPKKAPTQWKIVPKFGSGKDQKVERWPLNDEDLDPTTMVTTVTEGDVGCCQGTYVGPASAPPDWTHNRDLCVAQFDLLNKGAKTAEASLALNFVGEKGRAIELRKLTNGMAVISGVRVLAVVEPNSRAFHVELRSTSVVLSKSLRRHSWTDSGRRDEVCVRIPAWNAKADSAVLDEIQRLQPDPEQYWQSRLSSAMQVELPDPLLTKVIRASQIHCMMAARNEDGGKRVSPWIGADRYGPLESESNSIIRGMDMMGQTEFARRSLEFFIHRYNKAGFLTTGYTLVGTGEHLWTLAEHYERTRDREWMKRIAPDVARVCQWIVRQREKTKKLDVHGQKVPEYGLMPPGVTADWGRYAYRFFNDAQYCAGLAGAARALEDVGHPAAKNLAEEAKQYREDILRAYRWTQARSPVVRLANGTWVPGDPALLDCFGGVEGFLPGEDANRSWCYSIDVGAHHLAATGIFDPRSQDVDWMTDYLEDVQFLRSGMGDYKEENNRKDIFSFGGFAKVQPYYARIAEIYAARDDVKPFVRSYFNTIPTLLNLENLSFWEHFHNMGGWNKTHETGWFLCQTRTMLITERGDDLWLAPMVTNHWFEDGMKISVKNAPTRFGPTGYEIHSAVAAGRIDATIEPPTRNPPKRIVIRLRHPQGKPIRSVTVQGKPHKDFDPVKETVTLAPAGEPIRVEAQY